jgi:hypothetical protein
MFSIRTLLLAIIALATVGILGHMLHDDWRQREVAAYRRCFNYWNFDPAADGKTLEQTCGEVP